MSRDLEETLPYSGTEEAATGNQEADLDVTLPYGTDQVPMSSTQDGPVADLDATLPYGIEVLEEEQQDTPSEDNLSEEQVPEKHRWMQEDEWGLSSLSEEPQRTRGGRILRTPSYLRDYVTSH